MAPYVISIEGPPGAGKGFLLKHLGTAGLGSAKCTVHLHPEAICHVLDFNTEPKRWALFTELFFLFSHALAPVSIAADYAFVEGSPISDKACYFDRIAATSMHPLEQEVYKEWYDLLRDRWHVDMPILLKADAHALLERIIDNGKTEQAHYSLEHLQCMSEAYMQGLDPEKTWVINCSMRFEDNSPQLVEIQQAIARLLTSVHPGRGKIGPGKP